MTYLRWMGIGLFLVLSACQSTEAGQGKKEPASAAQEMSGSQLWAQNCMQCHNSRSPASYSDAEWDVAMHHMRVRAPLSAEEHKKILAFLKSGR